MRVVCQLMTVFCFPINPWISTVSFTDISKISPTCTRLRPSGMWLEAWNYLRLGHTKPIGRVGKVVTAKITIHKRESWEGSIQIYCISIRFSPLTLYHHHFKIRLLYRILSYIFLIILLIFAMDFPAGRGAIISQFRVWPFPSTLIMTFGERNRNPGHHFAGI